jgi:hypothetical protein
VRHLDRLLGGLVLATSPRVQGHRALRQARAGAGRMARAMPFPRPASPLFRLGVSTALALLWIACGGNTVIESGDGGGGAAATSSGTGGDLCCAGPGPCFGDCIGGDCATGDFCDACTICRHGVACATDADCPPGATCDSSGFGPGLCTTGASCTSNADCPTGGACDTSFACYLTQP